MIRIAEVAVEGPVLSLEVSMVDVTLHGSCLHVFMPSISM